MLCSKVCNNDKEITLVRVETHFLTDLMFKSFQLSDDQAALVFGGTDSSQCHDLPLSSSDNFDVIIMMFNYDVDFDDNNRVFIG